MLIETHNVLPITTYSQVLSPERFNQFRSECELSNLTYQQTYPNRLFSDAQHESWLLDYFGEFAQTVAGNLSLSGNLQQIFLGIDLPNCRFMMHRSHADIGSVAIWSLDDMETTHLAMLDGSAAFDSDYLKMGQDLNIKKSLFGFQQNQALVIANQPRRHYWGFDRVIPACSVKRSVWIYFAH